MLAHKFRILVVEDEEHARKIYQRRLENIGYNCWIASNPSDASDLMARADFDLMILDIMMPGKSGMDFLPEVVVQHPEMAVVIDTLAFPDESRAIRDFVEQELQVPVRYVITTHYHADHAWGNHFFPGAIVIAHKLCRKYLQERGAPSLLTEQKNNPTFRQTKLPGSATIFCCQRNSQISMVFSLARTLFFATSHSSRIIFP